MRTHLVRARLCATALSPTHSSNSHLPFSPPIHTSHPHQRRKWRPSVLLSGLRGAAEARSLMHPPRTRLHLPSTTHHRRKWRPANIGLLPGLRRAAEARSLRCAFRAKRICRSSSGGARGAHPPRQGPLELTILKHYTILYYTVPEYTILYYTLIHYNILYYTILYYTVLYCTIL